MRYSATRCGVRRRHAGMPTTDRAPNRTPRKTRHQGRAFMRHIGITALAGAALLFAGAANAQVVDFSKVEISTIDLGNKTYMLTGQGGNITVAVGTDGIIMVDAQFAPLHDKIKA